MKMKLFADGQVQCVYARTKGDRSDQKDKVGFFENAKLTLDAKLDTKQVVERIKLSYKNFQDGLAKAPDYKVRQVRNNFFDGPAFLDVYAGAAVAQILQYQQGNKDYIAMLCLGDSLSALIGVDEKNQVHLLAQGVGHGIPPCKPNEEKLNKFSYFKQEQERIKNSSGSFYEDSRREYWMSLGDTLDHRGASMTREMTACQFPGCSAEPAVAIFELDASGQLKKCYDEKHAFTYADNVEGTVFKHVFGVVASDGLMSDCYQPKGALRFSTLVKLIQKQLEEQACIELPVLITQLYGELSRYKDNASIGLTVCHDQVHAEQIYPGFSSLTLADGHGKYNQQISTAIVNVLPRCMMDTFSLNTEFTIKLPKVKICDKDPFTYRHPRLLKIEYISSKEALLANAWQAPNPSKTTFNNARFTRLNADDKDADSKCNGYKGYLWINGSHFSYDFAFPPRLQQLTVVININKQLYFLKALLGAFKAFCMQVENHQTMKIDVVVNQENNVCQLSLRETFLQTIATFDKNVSCDTGSALDSMSYGPS